MSAPLPPPPPRLRTDDRFYARSFALAVTAALGIAFYRIIEPFLGPITWAIFLAFLVHPLHVRLTRKLRGRAHWSALALTVLVLIVFLGPLTALSAAFAAQVGQLLHFAQTTVADQARSNVLSFAEVPWVQDALVWLEETLDINTAQLRGWAAQGAQQILQSLASAGGRVFLGAVGTVVGFMLMVFMLFFFIRDGEDMLKTARDLIPMPRAYKARLFDHLSAVTRAMVFGTGLTALIQGTLVGIAFLITGLPSPVVFGVIAALTALLPFGGTAIVWVPAAIVLAAQGHWGWAIFMVVWGALLVSLVDNFVRPWLVSGRADVSTLTVFIGVLGGLAAFGAIGLFLGPVILALIIALIRFVLEMRQSELEPRPPA